MLTSVAVSLLSALAVRAAVVPDEPSPGRVYNEGSQCHLSWKGDGSSPTNWKDMTITLRTGSNLAMKDITVIATGQDGTVDGQYDYPCPDVTPQSAIYFYQFTAAGAAADGAQWTTRFTIADSTGATTPPANDKQPSGDAIPWGEGNLQSGTPSGQLSSGGVMSSTPAVSGSASGAPSASSAPSSSAATPSGMVTSARATTPTKAAAAAATSSASAASGSPNGAKGLSATLFSLAGAFGSSVMAFTLLL